jgi:hypothetical protein
MCGMETKHLMRLTYTKHMLSSRDILTGLSAGTDTG